MNKRNLKEFGEFGLINLIRNMAQANYRPGTVGIGDDCAVIPLDSLSIVPKEQSSVVLPRAIVLTTDSLVEGRHFRRDLISPGQLGWKALAVNLSDIAAMGARPVGALVCAQAPGTTEIGWIEEIYQGLIQCGARYSCPILGGDTVAASEVSFAITVIGCTENAPLLRSGARPGDDLWISGGIGFSALGLKFLLDEERTKGNRRDNHLADIYQRCLEAHLNPIPRLELGLALGQLAGVNSAIDVSDGLLQDAMHLAQESKVNLVISAESIFVPMPHSDSLLESLCGGEDYELLFSASSQSRQQILRCGQELGLTNLALIGRVEPVVGEGKPDVLINDLNSKTYSARELARNNALGYDHYR